MRKRILAAKIALAVALATGITAPIHAGIPTIDAANIIQTTVTAFESVAQTLKQVEQYQKQIEQYATQLQQYENMLQNTMAPAAYIWDQAQLTMNKLMEAQNALAFYQNRLGSLDSYLSKFQDVAYYRSSPCFNGSGGCTEAEWNAMNENRQLASESRKKANDDLLKTVRNQQEALKKDASQLQRLQAHAQGAEGQMQALGFANQLAGQQANQMLQIRGILLAQQTALGAKMQADADRQAIEQAAHEQLYKGLDKPTNRAKDKGF